MHHADNTKPGAKADDGSGVLRCKVMITHHISKIVEEKKVTSSDVTEVRTQGTLEYTQEQTGNCSAVRDATNEFTIDNGHHCGTDNYPGGIDDDGTVDSVLIEIIEDGSESNRVNGLGNGYPHRGHHSGTDHVMKVPEHVCKHNFNVSSPANEHNSEILLLKSVKSTEPANHTDQNGIAKADGTGMQTYAIILTIEDEAWMTPLISVVMGKTTCAIESDALTGIILFLVDQSEEQVNAHETTAIVHCESTFIVQQLGTIRRISLDVIDEYMHRSLGDSFNSPDVNHGCKYVHKGPRDGSVGHDTSIDPIGDDRKIVHEIIDEEEQFSFFFLLWGRGLILSRGRRRYNLLHYGGFVTFLDAP